MTVSPDGSNVLATAGNMILVGNGAGSRTEIVFWETDIGITGGIGGREPALKLQKN